MILFVFQLFLGAWGFLPSPTEDDETSPLSSHDSTVLTTSMSSQKSTNQKKVEIKLKLISLLNFKNFFDHYHYLKLSRK